METKGIVQNSVTYLGKVNIKYKKNGKIYEIKNHNTGTRNLSDTISKALAGEDVKNDIPKFLDFVYEVNDTTYRLISTLIPFTGVVWGDSVPGSSPDRNYGSLFLTATILPEDITTKLNANDVQKSSYKLSLLMKSISGEVLAELNSDELKTMYLSLVGGTQAIIQWKMQFFNGVEE